MADQNEKPWDVLSWWLWLPIGAFGAIHFFLEADLAGAVICTAFAGFGGYLLWGKLQDWKSGKS